MQLGKRPSLPPASFYESGSGDANVAGAELRPLTTPSGLPARTCRAERARRLAFTSAESGGGGAHASSDE